jgi:hypothetical protein
MKNPYVLQDRMGALVSADKNERDPKKFDISYTNDAPKAKHFRSKAAARRFSEEYKLPDFRPALAERDPVLAAALRMADAEARQ